MNHLPDPQTSQLHPSDLSKPLRRVISFHPLVFKTERLSVLCDSGSQHV